MNLIYGVKTVMHRIRVKLYPNYLPGHENTFIARTDSEAVINTEQVCAAMFERGGFTGNKKDLITYIEQYNDEVRYQLMDGFAVSNGSYTIYPNIGGTFKNSDEKPDPKKNKLTYRFRPLGPMIEAAKATAVMIEGYADADGHARIYEFYDHYHNAVNEWFEVGGQFILTGSKIKIAGENPACGLYFIPAEGSQTPVKVDRPLENTATKITGLIPDIPFDKARIEVRTQFSSGTLLKEPRVITSKFTLQHS